MKLSEEITGIRLGFRCGHALSAASVLAARNQRNWNSTVKSRRNQYRQLFEAMQVGLFFQRAQTIRNLLAEPHKHGRKWTSDGWDQPGRTTVAHRSSKKNKRQMSTTSGLVTELERIATALSAEDGSASQFSLASVAEKIAKTLSVRKDEVAIMGVSTRWRHLHFLVPEALKNVGFIPLSSNSALAA